MIARGRALLVALLLAVCAMAAGAQESVPQDGARSGPDYESFDAFADLVEANLETGASATFLLTSQRERLDDWRSTLLDAQDANAARMRTLAAQIAALGTPPEDGAEDARVAARRVELRAEMQALRAPGLLADEARARASGLIAEIDTEIRDRQARALTERGPAPVNPINWTAAAMSLSSGLGNLYAEAGDILSTPAEWRMFQDRILAASFLGILALVLLVRGRRWALRLEAMGRSDRKLPRQRAMGFIVSLGQVALPFLGIVLLIGAVQSTGVLGLRGRTLAGALPLAILCVQVARWLSDRFFPVVAEGKSSGPLSVTREGAGWLRRYSNGLGWTLAVYALAEAFVRIADAPEAARGVLFLPIHAVTGFFIFLFGRTLAREMRRSTVEEENAIGFRDRIVAAFARVVMIAGIAGPVVAALGYDAAASFFLRPAALTLALLGLTILLQQLVFDTYAAISSSADGGHDALAPVLIGFALALVAVPLLALIWGARVSDLTELWTQFRTGFDFGDTRISPSDFMVFVIIFAAGYILTRLLQGGLRSAVLPKTRLDIGGQNAIASGVGYLGIVAAALIAITAAGVNLSTLGYVAGALSVGIGFGLQNIVSNFVSGIILLIERPISQGDWIEVGGQMGYVRDISVRATRIETFDRTDVIVPNADFISGTVINWTRGNSVGRIILPIGVAYGTDTHKVSDILLKIAREHPMVLHNPEPYVLFKGFGADALEFEIRAILRDINWVLSVQTEMNHAIAKAFAEDGIEIPFAQRDIWLRNAEVLHPGAGSAPARSTTGPSEGWSEALRAEKPDILRGEDE